MSRYGRTRVVFVADPFGKAVTKPYQDFLPPPDEESPLFEYTQHTADALHIMAFNLLGDSTMWWAIAEMNTIIDPFEPLEEPVLRVPTQASVQFLLTAEED